MNKKDAHSQNSLLQELVKVKKLRFKDIEDERTRPQFSKDCVQRRANFEEFKAVYNDGVIGRKSSLSLYKEPYVIHETNSGSFCKYPKAKKEARYIETVNIELPIHYGADRAVQIIENKIKPKTLSRTRKVNREVVTEKDDRRSPHRPEPVANIRKKSVTIAEKLNTIEETAHSRPESTTDITNSHLKEIQKHIKARKERIYKTLPKPTIQKQIKKKTTNDKIMNALENINEKLQKMQDKYFNIPRIQYKNVNDCFTQSGNLELIYENETYPEERITSNTVTKYDWNKISGNVLSDNKMQERIKEMNDMFPEFPKIEDTLKEIETHLDNIVNLEIKSNSDQRNMNVLSDGKFNEQISKVWNGGNLVEILQTLGNEKPLYESITEQILRKREQAKGEKLKTIRQQIDQVEDFCDRLSEIANDERVEVGSVSSIITTITEEPQETKKDSISSPRKPPEVTDFIEGPDLHASIKKSNYLCKEFNVSSKAPMVKIFSENRNSFWRDRMKKKRQNEDYSVESVTNMIDSLKYTLESSIYQPVV